MAMNSGTVKCTCGHTFTVTTLSVTPVCPKCKNGERGKVNGKFTLVN
jgi:predicted Zn-ribbon and HTH transcriptional regulator